MKTNQMFIAHLVAKIPLEDIIHSRTQGRKKGGKEMSAEHTHREMKRKALAEFQR